MAAKEQKDGVCEKFLHYLSVKSIDTHTHYGRVEGVKSVRCPVGGEEEGLFKAKR